MLRTTHLLAAVLAFIPAVHAQSPGPLSADAKAAWTTISGNIVKAAEKLPESDYSFRPAEGVRTYGQLIGHVTDAHYAFCGPLSSEKKASPGAEKKLTSKTELVAALKESVAYCTAAVDAMTDAQAAEMVKLFGRDKPKLSALTMNIAHDNEHYGNIVTYLRIKGVVPPSSEKR